MIPKMRHITNALRKMKDQYDIDDRFIEIENSDDVTGVVPVLKFTIQSDPVSDVGVNGLQANDILKYTKCLFESLNDAFSCTENVHTLLKLEEAIMWQEKRTRDRERRHVEGHNLP